MNKGRKKIIIIMVIIFLVLILAIGGVFAYLTTDLFKPNQTLFFKYIGQAISDLEYIENTQLSEIENLKEEMPYTVSANLNFEAGEENTDINANILSRMSINLESKINRPEEKAYTKANVTNNNQNIFTLEYANNDNIYALKSDEIANAFIGIENDNLKVLAQKLGMLDTTVIPDSIEPIDINEILKITDEEKNHITETYLSILVQNISKDNYSKEKDLTVMKDDVTYTATGYRLSLNAEELKQIQIALLQTLKEDSITLNLITTKAKLLGLDENYTQINNFTTIIDKQIKTINNKSYEINEGIDIIVYLDKQEVIYTEIIFRNKMKYTIYGEKQENSNKRHLLIENLSATEEYNKIEIEQIETRSNIESTNNILINMDDNIGLNIYLENTGSAAENNLNTTCEVSISQGELTSIIRYEQEMNFQDETDDIFEVTRNNTAVLNDYTTEQIQSLMLSIIQRIQAIITEKKQVIGWVENNQIYDPELELIEEMNNTEEML